MRHKVILICSICLARNYQTTTSMNQTKRLALKKHCPTCNKSTLHQQSQ